MEATKSIDPYSPIAQEIDKVIPISEDELIKGKITHQKVVHRKLRYHDASSMSCSICKKTRCNVGMMKSRDTNIIATDTPWMNAIGIPNIVHTSLIQP